MAFIKLFILLLITLSTISIAADNSTDDDWEVHDIQDECSPEMTKAQKEAKKISDFSSYAYSRISRELKDRHTKIGVFAGPYLLKGGQAQSVPIVGLIGDTFSLNRTVSTYALVGGGVYIDSLEFEHDNFGLQYTITGYDLLPAQIQGQVTQENLVTNLEYSYALTNVAGYVGFRLINFLGGNRVNLTFDGGVGVNKVSTNIFIEKPLVNYALPDNAFRGAQMIQFSYTFGLGIQLRDVFGKQPLGCGYTFLYLGEGELTSINTQIPNPLKTGKNYANAILCSVQLG